MKNVTHKPGGVDGRICWETPDDMYQALDREFNFQWDLAASEANSKAVNFFTAQDDALTKEWPRVNCWLNPPYGGAMKAWAEKVLIEARAGTTVVMLVPARTDTRWWHLLAPNVAEIRLLKGRVKFKGAIAYAPFSSAILVATPSMGPPVVSHVDIPRGISSL